jgi:hypothetical protein
MYPRLKLIIEIDVMSSMLNMRRRYGLSNSEMHADC